MSYILDATNPQAVEWYLNQTRHLRDAYNVTSFKFDAGESNWLPNAYTPFSRILSPDEYSKRYIDMAYR